MGARVNSKVLLFLYSVLKYSWMELQYFSSSSRLPVKLQSWNWAGMIIILKTVASSVSSILIPSAFEYAEIAIILEKTKAGNLAARRP